MTKTAKPAFEIPTGLSRKGRKAAKIIRDFIIDNSLDCAPDTSKLFVRPKDWVERGEVYGHRSELILIHEGFEASEALSMDHASYSPSGYRLYEELQKKLHEEGMYFEEMTSWSCAVYESM